MLRLMVAYEGLLKYYITIKKKIGFEDYKEELN